MYIRTYVHTYVPMLPALCLSTSVLRQKVATDDTRHTINSPLVKEQGKLLLWLTLAKFRSKTDELTGRERSFPIKQLKVDMALKILEHNVNITLSS